MENQSTKPKFTWKDFWGWVNIAIHLGIIATLYVLSYIYG